MFSPLITTNHNHLFGFDPFNVPETPDSIQGINDIAFNFDPFDILRTSNNLPRIKDLKTDIKEEDDHYLMEIEIPGVNKEDIDISFADGYLNVTASRNIDKNEKDEKGNFIRRERFSGKVSRGYYVGDISEEDIKAKFENGVLEVRYPKPDSGIPKVKAIAIE